MWKVQICRTTAFYANTKKIKPVLHHIKRELSNFTTISTSLNFVTVVSVDNGFTEMLLPPTREATYYIFWMLGYDQFRFKTFTLRKNISKQ